MKPITIGLGGSIALLIALCLTGSAQAAECSGYDVLVRQSLETTELAKGHTITVVRSHSMLVTDNPTDKYNLTIGECSGTLVTANGTTTGSGHCARRDTSGDSYSLEWAIAPGAERGTWKAVAGTGKFSRRTDSGWFQNVARDGKMSASKWGGTCE